MPSGTRIAGTTYLSQQGNRKRDFNLATSPHAGIASCLHVPLHQAQEPSKFLCMQAGGPLGLKLLVRTTFQRHAMEALQRHVTIVGP